LGDVNVRSDLLRVPARMSEMLRRVGDAVYGVQHAGRRDRYQRALSGL
jgi:hypothetical protein